MATQADVRRIAMSLPGTQQSGGRFAFEVMHKGKAKGYAWVWLERTAPKKPRVPNPRVLALRVASLAEKDMMLAAEPAKFFTEPHYNGYPAVLLRLEAVAATELRELLTDAWRVLAPSDGTANPATPRGRATAARKRGTGTAETSKSTRRRKGE